VSLTVGQSFPLDIAVQTARGPATVAELIDGAPAVVAFHRLWCPFCQQAASELAAAQDQLAAAGARVILVYRHNSDTVGRACAQRGIPFDCVSDSSRRLEHATEIERFALTRYASFAPRRLISAWRSGRPGIPTTDLLQGRGTFVVGRDGRVVYCHHSAAAADIAPIDEVLDAVRAAAGQSDPQGPA
jgi:peroxiredoxin